MSGEKNLDHAESVQDVEVAPQVRFLALLLLTSQSSNGNSGNARELYWNRSQHSRESPGLEARPANCATLRGHLSSLLSGSFQHR